MSLSKFKMSSLKEKLADKEVEVVVEKKKVKKTVKKSKGRRR